MKKLLVILLFVLLMSWAMVACIPTEPNYSGGGSNISLDSQVVIDQATLVTRKDGLQCLVATGVWGAGNAQTMYVGISCDWDNWER